MNLKIKNNDNQNLKNNPEKVKPEVVLKQLHSFEGRLADLITYFAGSMNFVYLHVLAFTIFFILRPIEVEVFNILLSLEAIFLATFIMISQNRQALIDTYREYEEEQEQQEEEKEQEQLEEEVEDIQQDLDDIKKAMLFIQSKLDMLEKQKLQRASSSPSPKPQESKKS